MTVLTRQIWLTTPMMRGSDVLAVQRKLASLGAELGADGIYGIASRNAVVNFQRANGLEADGVVGMATWSKLFGADGGQPALPDSIADNVLDAAALKQEHRRYVDGCSWRVTAAGVEVAGAPLVTDNDQYDAVVRRVWQAFSQPLSTVLGPGSACRVPVELVIACICAESNGKPTAKRLEPGCDTANPARTPHRISIGLMQTLLSTAREALRKPDLPLDDLLVPEISIRAGATYIWRQGRLTGFDPPLVAAAYNAGGLYYNASNTNRWRLRQYPLGTSAHVDRYVHFFNAAMRNASMFENQARLPSMAKLLAG